MLLLRCSVWSFDTSDTPKIVLLLFFTWYIWLTYLSSQHVITLVDIFFFIADIKLFSDPFYSLFLWTLQCARVCLCAWKVSTMLNINFNTDPFSSQSKFKLLKMKVVECISAKLAFKHASLWRWKISNIKIILCVL